MTDGSLVSAIVADWASRVPTPFDVATAGQVFTATDGTSAWIVSPVAGRVVSLADQSRGTRRLVATTNDSAVIDRYLLCLFASLVIGPAAQLPGSKGLLQGVTIESSPPDQSGDEPLETIRWGEGLWAQSPVSRGAELRLIARLLPYSPADLHDWFSRQVTATVPGT